MMGGDGPILVGGGGYGNDLPGGRASTSMRSGVLGSAPELQELMLKFCIVGEQNVGKSSLVSRLRSNVFKERMDFTVGVETHTYQLDVEEDGGRRRPVLLPSLKW